MSRWRVKLFNLGVLRASEIFTPSRGGVELEDDEMESLEETKKKSEIWIKEGNQLGEFFE
jgi:predicted transcriptional regulator